MTRLEEKFPVPLAIRSSSRVDLTRPKGGNRCDGGPCRRTTKKGWPFPCYFLPPLASLTESTGHAQTKRNRPRMTVMRSIFSVVIACSLAKSTQHEPKAAVGSTEVGETHAGVGGINLIYAPHSIMESTQRSLAAQVEISYLDSRLGM